MWADDERAHIRAMIREGERMREEKRQREQRRLINRLRRLPAALRRAAG